MNRRAWAAMAASAAVISGPASADIMRMSLFGDFNDDDFYGSWFYTVTYNTKLGVRSDFPGGGRVLSWDASSGEPSPVIAVDGYIGAISDPPWWWDPEFPYVPPSDIAFHWRDFTSFSLRLGAQLDHMSVISVDGNVAPGLGPTDVLGDDLTFETEFNLGTAWYGHWSFPTNSPHLHSVSVTRLTESVPEPESWTLLIMGFMATASALRRSRKPPPQICERA
jgi:hypothetical protein